ncbi:protein of unknown function [Oribacterium sp. KHPX15]|uniref:DUF4349 domain-containing protein n=1 Tax=Oribacterium sp. KHPX15 TaxID=1855342 RepID=UPI000897F315|nr:DUF4349 domain-containing protein [Oribacterium sp. KHPX15]SEA24554.1 protein of unknown function [Oribacterium sp. KHPX15]
MKKRSIKLNLKKVTALTAAFVLSVMALIACGSKSSATSDNYNYKSAGSNYMSEARMPMADAAAGADMYSANYAEEADEGAVLGAAYSSETAADGSENSNVDTQKIPDDRKLIRNVNLSFETTEFDSFVRDIQNRTTELGGYVESSDINGNAKTNSSRYAYFTLRIPKPQVDAFLEFAEGSANLTRKYENTQDITLKYHDTESRKKALKEEYNRLLELMAQAESVDAIISIEERLSDIRYELENYESNLRSYDNQVEYSTITVDVSETKVYTPTPKTTFWGRIAANLESNLVDLAEAMTDFLIWFISSIPVFIFLAIIFFILKFIVKGIINACRKGAEKRAAKKAAKMTGIPTPSAPIPATPTTADVKPEPAEAASNDKTEPAAAAKASETNETSEKTDNEK